MIKMNFYHQLMLQSNHSNHIILTRKHIGNFSFHNSNPIGICGILSITFLTTKFFLVINGVVVINSYNPQFMLRCVMCHLSLAQIDVKVFIQGEEQKAFELQQRTQHKFIEKTHF